MTVVESNRQILSYWYNLSPSTLQGIELQGNFLVYNGEKVDISKFSFHEIMSGNSFLTDQITSLSPDDFFKIIKLHCLLLQGNNNKKDKKDDSHNKEMLDVIKKTDPGMRNVRIIDRVRDGIKSQYFSVIDESGIPHIFYNDRNVDILAIYTELKRTYGDSYTVNDLIASLNQKLYDINLQSSTTLIDSPKTSEDFKNKLKNLNNQYKGDLSKKIYADQKNDITVVSDATDINRTKVITYDRDKDGSLIAETHMQIEKDNEINKTIDAEKVKEENKEDNLKDEIPLIPYNDFISLLESQVPYNEEQRKRVDLWYSTIGDLIIYEDFLCDRAVAVLRNFTNYLQTIEINADQNPLTEHQVEALDKYREMVGKKENLNKDDLEDKKKNVIKLTKRLEKDAQAGNVSVIQIIWTIIGIATILTAITLYVVS